MLTMFQLQLVTCAVPDQGGHQRSICFVYIVRSPRTARNLFCFFWCCCRCGRWYRCWWCAFFCWPVPKSSSSRGKTEPAVPCASAPVRGGCRAVSEEVVLRPGVFRGTYVQTARYVSRMSRRGGDGETEGGARRERPMEDGGGGKSAKTGRCDNIASRR